MRRRYLVLATVLILATVMVGRAMGGPRAYDSSPVSSPAADGRDAVASPIPQVLIGQEPTWDPLPEGCSPERVTSIVLEFVDAFNRGDQSRLAALFRPDVSDANGTPDLWEQPDPGWFWVVREPGVDARSDEELLAWVKTRQARGEHWTLLQLFMGGFWWKGGVNISFDLRREADDLPAVVVGGKGAIDCDDGTVFLWSTGGGEVLPDHLFDPNATVSPAVGFDPPFRTV